MRTPLRHLALTLLLAAPLRAAVVETVPLAPAIGSIATAPAFQAAVMTQVQLASSLSAAPAPALTLAPLTAAAAAPAPAAEPYRAEAARLVAGFVTQPKSLKPNKDFIVANFGEATYDSLVKSSSRVASKMPANPALKAEVAEFRKTFDLSREDSVADLGAKLNAAFDNAKSAPAADLAPAVAAGAESGTHKPLVGLLHHGEKPAMSHAELAAYVASHEVVTPRGMKKVNFASGDYRPEYDAALKQMGVDVVVIKTPSRAEVEHYTEKDGYYLKSEYERWVMTTRTLDEHKQALGKAQRVRQFENQLESSAHIPTKLIPLTVEDFAKWYPVYEDEVVGKPGGKRNIGADFAQKQADQGKLDGWYGLWYYDKEDPTKIVGGVIMKAWPERGMFVLGYAAYRPELKDVSPSVRTFAESMKLAKQLGYPVLSFGQDTNLFGYDYNLGLMSNKAGFLLTPYPEDEVVLMKVLDRSKFDSVKNGQGKSGGYFFFGIKRDSPVAARYLESRDAGTPKEAQELLGSPHYFDGKVTPAKDVVVAVHAKGDDPNPLRVPVGIDVVETAH